MPQWRSSWALPGGDLKDFDAFAFGVFGSQIWKVLQRTRNYRRVNEVQEVMKDVLRDSQALLEVVSMVSRNFKIIRAKISARLSPRSFFATIISVKKNY
jgi:hypothetical protein